jgi:shikimate kinase
MPGSGKSTVGPLVAERLAMDFVDLDDVIERDAGLTIEAIYADGGEEAFRDLEEAALADAVTTAGTVVGCGGGAVLRPANRARLKAAGRVVWIRVPGEVADERARREPRGRPIVTMTDSLVPVAEARRPFYEEVATVVVDGTRAPIEVADAVAEAMA